MTDLKPKKNLPKWISMQEASSHVPYSQEYLSLLARRGKLSARKIGRNWYTTQEELTRYLTEESLLASASRQMFSSQNNPQVVLASSDNGTPTTPAEKPLSIIEEFRRLNPSTEASKKIESVHKLASVEIPALPPQIETPVKTPDSSVLQKLDRLSDSLELFASQVSQTVSQVAEKTNTSQEAINQVIYTQEEGVGSGFKRFNKLSNSITKTPVGMMALVVTAIVTLFVFVGGFSFGQVDALTQRVKKAFTDATTIDGHFAGTHANEVLVLDKNGNISIYGHIETEGQLRSHAPEGVAPFVVDSITKVDNLNADLLDNLSSQDFTLAFVTKNGNLTYEDIKLEGNVEVGKTLIVRGATKLLDSLQVYGNLGVFGDATFGKNVSLTGGDLTIKKGNLNITKGSIVINNMSLVKNLNAEYLDGLTKGGINLQFVTSNGDTTTNAITVGGITSNGVGFFNRGVWGTTGSFGIVGASELGINKSAIIGDKNNSSAGTFQVYSSQFTVDAVGTTTTNNLVVNSFVGSDLIPSSSFSLGSLTNPWSTVFANNLIVSGSANFSGTTSRSFVINTDNVASDSEDAYIAFDRGTITPSARLSWDSTLKQFSFNEPVNIASGSFTVSVGPVGVGTTSPNASALLDLTSTTRGFLGPRMTQAQRDAISSPVAGLLIFNTDTSTYNAYNGSTWLPVGALKTKEGTSTIQANSNTLTFSPSGFVLTASGSTDTLVSIDYVNGPASRSIAQSITGLWTFVNGASVSTNFEVVNYASLSNTLFVNNGQVSVGTTSPDASALLDLTSTTRGFLGPRMTQAQRDVISLPAAGLLVFNTDTSTYNAYNGTTWLPVGALKTKEGSGVVLPNSNTLTFSPSGFTVVASGSTDTLVGIDYVNGPASRSIAQSITGLWTFVNGASVSTNFEVGGTASIGGNLSIQGNQTLAGTLSVSGLSSLSNASSSGTFEASSNLVANNVLQVGGTSAVSYSRFGIGTTSHSNYISASDDVLISGDLEVVGTASFDNNVVLGTTSTSILLVNSTVKSNLIPFTNAYNLGSTTNHWGSLYVDTAHITTLDAPTASISGTTTSDWLINSDNISVDTENQSVTFKRGSPTVNAAMQWDSTNKLFNFNFPILVQTADLPESTYNFTNVTLKGAFDQAGHRYFEIKNYDGSGLLAVGRGGWLTASGSFQAGGGSLATASYSRFGTTATTHNLSAASDLLVSGKLEVAGTAYFNTGSIANFSIASASYFYAQDGTVGSPSFSFSADQNTGIFRKAGDSFSISAGGIERLNLTSSTASISNNIYVSSGNVAIGTTTPSSGSKLTVSGTTQFGTGAWPTSTFTQNSDKVLLTSTNNPILILNNYNNPNTNQGGEIFLGGRGTNSTNDMAYARIFGARENATSGNFATYLRLNTMSSGGTEISGIHIDSSGNVGFGTTAPNGHLTIKGDEASTGGIILEDSSGNDVGGLYQTSNDFYVQNTRLAASKLYLGTVGNTQTLTLLSGNVGINYGGTLDTKFEVGGTASISGTLSLAGIISSSSTGSNSFAGSLDITKGLRASNFTQVGTSTNYFNGNVGIGTTVPGAKLEINNGVSSDQLRISDDNSAGNYFKIGRNTAIGSLDIQGTQAGANNIALAPTSGNVGIGTTGPSQKLDVSAASNGDGIVIYGRLDSSAAPTLKFRQSSTVSSAWRDWAISANAVVNGALGFSVGSARGVDGYGGTQVMTLTEAGNVGIGNTTPDTKLDVSGTASASLFYGQFGSAGAPTYSFSVDPNTGIFNSGADQIAFSSGGITRMTQDTDSFYGVGTGAPRINTKSTATFDEATYSFVGDQDTGMYRGGANELRFSTANTDRLTINSSGNVGIGTTVPGALLDIRSSVAAGDFPLMIRGNIDNAGTGYTGIKFGYEAGVGAYEAAAIMVRGTSGFVQPEMHFLLVNSTDGRNADINDAKLSILPTGNVGIGTTAPSAKLDVVSDVIFREGLQVAGTATASYSRFGTNTTGHALSGANSLLISGDLEVDGSVYYDGIVNFGSIASASLFYAGNGSAASPSFSFRADQDTGMFRSALNQLGFSTLGAERLTIDSTGNVGIGSTAPGAKLDVVGGANISGVMNLSGSNQMHQLSGHNFVQGDATLTYLYGGTGGIQIRKSDNSVPLWGINDTGNMTTAFDFGSNITYTIGGSGAAGHRFFQGDSTKTYLYGGTGGIEFRTSDNVSPLVNILDTGLVGIGTTAPTATYGLTVASASAGIAIKSTGSTASASLAFLPANGTADNKFTIRAGGLASTAGERLDILNGAGSKLVEIASAGGVTIVGTTGTAGFLSFSNSTAPETKVWNQYLQNEDLRFYDSADRMTLQGATGNVGIGSTAPIARLDVVGGAGNNAMFRVASASGIAALYVTKGSNVGIGTTTPSYKLDVVGDINIPTGSQYKINGVDQAFDKWTAGSGNDIYRLTGHVSIGTSSPVSGSIFNIASASAAFSIQSTESTASTSMVFLPANANSQNKFTIRAGGLASTAGERLEFLNGANTSLVTIASSGNVGIGTTNPGTNLQVNSATGGAIRFQYTGNSGYGQIETGAANDLIFKTSGAAGTNTRMTILETNGNVGIGTTAPHGPLEVSAAAGGTADGLTNPIMVRDSGNTNAYLQMGWQAAGVGMLTARSTDGQANLAFGTGGSERVRIKYNGNVGIGTTDPTAGLYLTGSYGGGYTAYFENANVYGIGIKTTGTTASHQQLYITKGDNTLNFGTYADGTGYLRAAAWTYGSDSRLKENISYFNNGLDKINQLNPVHFDYIDGPANNLGFIAQDVQTVIPEAVSITNPATGMLGLKTDFIIPYLVNAIKELDIKFNSLASGSTTFTVNVASGSFNQLCIAGDCRSSWPTAGQNVDLSSYALKTDLTPFATTASLSNFVTNTQLTNALANLNIASASIDLSPYATTASLSAYAKLTDIPSLTNISGTISGHIIPNADNTYDLGSPTMRLANVYANNINAGDVTYSETTSALSGATLNVGDFLGLYVSSTSGSTHTVPIHLTDAFGNLSGNLGIGTTTATAKLEVNGSIKIKSGSGGSIVFADGTTMSSAGGLLSGDSSIGDVNLVADTDNNGSGMINFVTAATNRMTILNNGNVGIGTAVPTALFEVNGSAKFNSSFTITGGLIGNSYASISSNFEVGGYASVGGNILTKGILTSSGTGSNSFAGSLSVTKGFSFPSGKITAGGNVGIGTTTPVAALDVGGNLIFASGSWQTEAGGNYSTVAGNDLNLRIPETRSLFVKVGGATKMTVDNTGNVGIGTTAPEGILDITKVGSSFTDQFLFSGFGSAGANRGIKFSVSDEGSSGGLGKIQAFRVTDDTVMPLVLNPAGGGVLIGATANVFSETSALFSSTGNIFTIKDTSGTGSNYVVFGNSADGVAGSINHNGAATVAYNASSDRRLKENIVATSAGLSTLVQIPVNDFNFISEPGKTVQGFIAQDLYDYYPEAVTVGGTNPATNPWQVDYGRLTPLLVKSVQELNTKFNALASGSYTFTVNVASGSFDELCLAGDCRSSWPVASNVDLTPFALTASLSNFVTNTQLTNALANLNIASASIDLSPYATTASLSAYAKLTDIPAPASLTNLSGTISGNIIPNADNTYDLGSPTMRLANVYANNINAGDVTYSETTSALSGATLAVGDFLGLYVSSIAGSTHTIPIHLTDAFGNLSGNLGIGTTTANSKLEVNGSIRIKSGSGGSIVFADGTTMSTAITGSSVGGSSIGDINFVADTDNNSSGQINFVTAATNRMTILNNGNVGIGTAVPAYAFDVAGSARFSGGLTFGSFASVSTNFETGGYASIGGNAYITGNTTLTGTLVGSSTGSNSFAGSLDLAKGLRQTGTSANYFTGNLGIGTTSPSNLLDIYSTATASMDIWSGGTATDKKFTIRSNYQGSGTSERLSFLNGANSELFTIASTGYVGIGTTAPTQKLDVYGGNIRIENGSNDSSLLFKNSASANTPYLTYRVADGRFGFVNTAGTENLTVLNGGNVGIGTTDPAQKLEVNGTARIPTIEANGTLTLGGGTTGYLRLLAGAGSVSDWTAGGANIRWDGVNFNVDGAIIADFPGSSYNYAAVSAFSNGTVSYFSSDRRLKKNIEPITDGLSVVRQLKPSTFNLIADDYYASGFIAQDVLNLVPGAATVTPNNGMLAFNVTGIVAYTAKAIQELDARTSFITSNTASSSMYVTPNGNIGIGTASASYKLHVIGDIAGTSFVNISTRTAKKDIEYIDGATKDSMLDKLENLRIAKYHYNEEDYSSPLRLGLIAEEAPAEVLAIGGKGVDIYKLATFTLAGVQELATKVDSQWNYFESLQAQVASLSLTVDQLMNPASASFATTASGSTNVVVSSSTSPTDILATLANTVMTKVQSVWASGDIIAEGIKKTYFSIASLFDGIPDIASSISNWTSREVVIDPRANDSTKSAFSGNSAQAADESKVDLKEDGTYLATYGVDSTRGEIQLSGTAQIINGEAKIFFDYSFTSITSDVTPIRVIITPTSVMQGQIYVESRSQYGFVVKELNSLDNGTFDWLVIARRKGFDSVVATPTPTPAPADTTTVTEPTPTTTPEPTPTPTDTTTSTGTTVVEPTPTPAPVDTTVVEPAPAPVDTTTTATTPEPTPTPVDTTTTTTVNTTSTTVDPAPAPVDTSTTPADTTTTP